MLGHRWDRAQREEIYILTHTKCNDGRPLDEEPAKTVVRFLYNIVEGALYS